MQLEFKELLKRVAKALEITPEQVLQASRKRPLVEARYIMYLLLDQQNESPTAIADRFNQCRTTVIHGLDQAQNLLNYDRFFTAKYEKCTKAIESQLSEK